MRNLFCFMIVCFFWCTAQTVQGQLAENKQDTPNGTKLDLSEVVLEANVNPAVAKTNEFVTYEIILKTKESFSSIQIPEVGGNLTGFRVVDFGQKGPEKDDEYSVSKRWYKLQADLAGSYVIPFVSVSYNDMKGNVQSVKTADIFVEIQSSDMNSQTPTVNGGDKRNDIRDIKQLAFLGWHPVWKWLMVLIVSVLIVGVGLFFIRIWKKRKTSHSEPKLSPKEVAFQQLLELRKANFTTWEEIKRFCFEVSNIVRSYVEAQFGVAATDRTTDELSIEMEHVSNVSSGDKHLFLQLLVATDFIKFTDYLPDINFKSKILDELEIFLNNTSPPLTTLDRLNDKGIGGSERQVA